MKLFYTLATGFVLIGAYRILLYAGTLFVDELTSIVGKTQANEILVPITLFVFVIFGLLARLYVEATR